ncbi:MAG: TadE/TadG family type IV pilus assembly protein [Bryobacteraceae bacterium]
MNAQGRERQRGAVLIEFALTLIPLLMVFFGIIGMALTMWAYNTLSFAVREGARYAASKGQNCNTYGNNCAATVADIAQYIASAGVGLDPSQLNLTLTSAAGTVSCLPLQSCYSNSSIWPPPSANAPGTNYIDLSGSYPTPLGLSLLFLPNTSSTSSLRLPASCRQPIQF